MARLIEHRYGKAGVRLLRMDRSREPHRLFEADIEIRLEGAFDEAYTAGDNSRVVPTDTMKNTVYALARQEPFEGPEELGILLARHFLTTKDQVRKAVVAVVERPWERFEEHPAAFLGGRGDRETATITGTETGEGLDVRVTQGVANLLILKSSDSGFEGFPRDRYTTLAEAADRILATRLTAEWAVGGTEHEWGRMRRRVLPALLDTFATHASRSVQHTLHAMAEAALEAEPAIDTIRLEMPNKHYLLADLSPFGLDNPNRIFVPTDEPAGMIEATLGR